MNNIQLRYLKPMYIKKVTKTKNANGSDKETYTDVMTVKGRINEYMTYGNRNNIFDQIKDLDVGKTYRKKYIVSSPNRTLENFASSKMDNSDDNLDNYILVYNNEMFTMQDSKVSIVRIGDWNE